jgi:hypothetical protein
LLLAPPKAPAFVIGPSAWKVRSLSVRTLIRKFRYTPRHSLST